MQTLSPSAPGRLILLVDDEALVRMGVALLLEELDHRVLQAANASQGLQLLSENKDIEILITDFRMPDMDGISFIERAREISPTIFAILTTGYAANDSRFGDLDVPRLTKPFGITELEAALATSR
jgi:CheY-like chemotaxis protein